MKKITNFTKNRKLCEGIERLTDIGGCPPIIYSLVLAETQFSSDGGQPSPPPPLNMTEESVTLFQCQSKSWLVSDEFKCWQFWSSENVCWDASGKRSLTPKELLRSLSTLVHSHVWVWLLELQQPFHKQEEKNGGQSWDSEEGSTERWKDSGPLMTPSRC